MKIKHLAVAVLGLGAVVLPAASFAAAATLKNGGLGQSAGNVGSFGVAVCNKGSKAITASVPVMVTANGMTATVGSAASIKAGACAYSNLSYAQLGMQAGRTYPVTVTINGGDQAVYNVTVPGGSPTVAPTPSPTGQGSADVSTQSGNLWTWLSSFTSRLFHN